MCIRDRRELIDAMVRLVLKVDTSALKELVEQSEALLEDCLLYTSKGREQKNSPNYFIGNGINLVESVLAIIKANKKERA